MHRRIAFLLLLGQSLLLSAQVLPAPVLPSDREKAGLTEKRTQELITRSDALLKNGVHDWYLGEDYSLKYINALGSPYFYDNSLVHGSISFGHRVYGDLDLLYDLEHDAMVLLAEKQGKMTYVELNRAWVQWVKLCPRSDTLHFITEGHPALKDLEIDEGYYEVRYSGKHLSVVSRHSKTLEFRADRTDHNQYVYAREMYHIREGLLVDISREKDLWELYPELKGELKALRKQSGKKYEHMDPEELAALFLLCENQGGKTPYRDR